MFFFDIQNESVLGMEAAQSAIAFVAFSDKIFAAWVPVRVRSENRNFGANVMGWMQAAFAQNVRRHCRGSCFAMHSGDNNAALRAHDCGEGFRATDDGFSRITPGHENGIVALNCGGKNNKVSGACVFRTMLFIKAQPAPLQSICFHCVGLV